MGDATWRIILLGKSGVGRSSLANTICGEELFTVNHGISSSKRKCETQTGSINGQRLTLVDTPGFIDPDRSEEELKPEILGCISQCSPGPHAFLIVFKVQTFTEQEKDVITNICQYFSEEVLKYAVVVFTCGDQLPEGTKIEEFVNQNKDLSDLMKKCSGRCHVVDNKYWKNKQQGEYRSNQFQVAQLLNTIEKMVKNRGGCYTAEMLQEWQEEQEKNIESPSFLNIKYLKTFLSKRPVMAAGAVIFGVLLISKMMKTKAVIHFMPVIANLFWPVTPF